MPTSRRSFITAASMLAAGNALGFQPFGMLNALAQTNSTYKALVCVFLYGGNDGNNMLVPFDSKGYASYSSLRGPLALPQSSLLPLSAQPNFALHPSIPEVQSLFDSGNAAFLVNVGTLLQPTTRAQYQSKAVTTPTNLFSHPDQQSEWQNQMQAAGGASGWAGRLADKLTAQYNPGALVPMIASIDGDTLFCNGIQTSPVSMGTLGPVTPTCSDRAVYCDLRMQTAQQLTTLSSGVSLVQADNEITGNANKFNAVLKEALASISPLKTVFPTANNPLAAQLQQVANVISARAALNVSRQIFFVGLENFDTHGDQLATQAGLLTELSQALGAFSQAMVELNVSNQVTTFTCSDFARSFQPNSNGGSEHGWGGHHIIFGGAVKGGIYGQFPTLALGGPNDASSNGRWIPTTSSSQYAATLAQWFGLPASDLAYVLPSIGNFSSNNLGFL